MIAHSPPRGLTPEQVAECYSATVVDGAALARLRTVWPQATVDFDPESRHWWAHSRNGSGYLCASPEARAARESGRRCCIGGPCHEPAVGATADEALTLALRGVGL